MKRSLQMLLLVSMFFMLTPACRAANTQPESIRELIVFALQNNIGLQVESLNRPIAMSDNVVSAAVFDTELFMSTSYSETSIPIDSSITLLNSSDSEVWNAEAGLRKKFTTGLESTLSLTTEWQDDNDTSELLDPRYRSGLSLLLDQPLLKNFGVDVNTTEIKLTANRAIKTDLQFLLHARTLALQIEQLTEQLAGQARIVKLREEAVALAQELLTANRRRFNSGVIAVTEVQEAETALAQRELDHSLAQQVAELSYEQLNRQLNNQLDRNFDAFSFYPFVTPETPQLPPFESLFSSAKEQNIALQQAVLDVKNTNLQRQYYRNLLKPKLDLQVQLGLVGLAGEESSSVSGSRYDGSWGDSWNSAADADGYQWSAGLVFSWPFGNRTGKAKMRQAELQNKQAEYLKRDLDAELRNQLRQEIVNLERTYEQVKIAQRFESLAALSLQQEQRRLEEGLSDTFRILSFQDKMIAARIGRINALIQYYATVSQLSYSRGIILQQYGIVLPEITEENSFENI